MFQDKYVFAQLTAFLNRTQFNNYVRKYDGNRYVKHFTCWNQLLRWCSAIFHRSETLTRPLCTVKAAKKQGCKIVVIDLDEHILQVRSFELSKYISRRKADFVNGMIAECFVVYNGEAVVVNASIQTRQEIMSTIEQLNPGAPSH